MSNQPATLCGNGGVLPQQLSTGCPSGSAYATTCTDPASTIPGVREEWFSAQRSFYPYGTGGVIDVTPEYIYRDTNVYNVSGTNTPGSFPGGERMRWTYPKLLITLNNAGGRINNSPCFTSKPVPYVCTGSPFTYNMGAVDPDGDSLHYELVMPANSYGGEPCLIPSVSGPYMDYCGCPMVFTSPSYNLVNNPFATNNTFSLDPATGQISFTSAQDGMATIAIKVSEYRGGLLVGTSMREMNIISLPCSAPQPSLTPKAATFSPATQYTGGRIEGCAGKPLSFCADIRSATATAQLVAHDNSALATPGAATAFTNTLTDSVRFCYNWTPTAADTGLHNLVITVKDSVCTPPGFPITHTLTLPVYIHPITVASPDTAICQGASAPLRAVGGGPLTWSVLPGGAPLSSLSCTTCANPVATPAVTTRYVVTSLRGSFCNRDKDTVTVTVAETPHYRLPKDTAVCRSGFTLPLTVQPAVATAFTYQWSPAWGLSSDTARNPVATPATDTTYYLTITPGGVTTCAVSDSIRVRVPGTLTLLNNGVSGCIGQPYTVEATTTDTRYRYRWLKLPASAGNISNDTVLTPIITPLTDTGVYVLEARFPGCPLRTDTLRIFSEPVPIVVLRQGDTTLCIGDTLRLSALVSPPSAAYDYQWSAPPGSRLSNPSGPSPLLTAGGSGGAVRLTVSAAGGRCADTQSFNLTVRPGGTLTVAPADTLICPGGAVPLRASGAGITQVQWLPASGLLNITPMTATAYPQGAVRYAAVGINAAGCRDTGWAAVTVRGLFLELPDTLYIQTGDTAQLSLTASEWVVSYLWGPDRWISNVREEMPLVWPQQSTAYTVVAQLAGGCQASGEVFVKVTNGDGLPVPSAFAPAAEPGGFKTARFGSYKLRRFTVYNRWGNRLFETADPAQGWDGTYNGNAQPEGTYIYLIEATAPGGRPYLQKGTVLLMR